MDFLLKLAPPPLRELAERMLKGESHGARSSRNAMSAFLIRVFSAGLVFVSQVMFARWLGAHDFGIFTFVLVLVNVIGTLCPIGYATSVVRFLPEYRERNEHGLAQGFLLTGGLVAFGTGVLAMATGLSILFGFEGVVPDYYRVPLALGFLCLPAYALTDYMDGVGRSQSWMNLALAPPYIVRPMLILALIGASAAIGLSHTASTAVLCAALAMWLTTLAQYVALSRRLREHLPAAPRRYALKGWMLVSGPLVLLEGFSILLLNVDILLLDLFVTPDQIGIYFAAARTISLIAFIHFAVSAATMPRFASLNAAGDREGLRSFLSQSRKWTFLPSLAGAIVILAVGRPLLWLFGPEFTASYPVMFVLVLGLLARAAAGPTQSLLVATGHQTLTAVVMAVTLGLNVVLNLILIPRYGIMGAGIATATAIMLESLILYLVSRRTTAGAGTPLAPALRHDAIVD